MHAQGVRINNAHVTCDDAPQAWGQLGPASTEKDGHLPKQAASWRAQNKDMQSPEAWTKSGPLPRGDDEGGYTALALERADFGPATW